MVLAVAFAGLAGGCGGENDASGEAAGATPAQALAGAAARLRDEGTFRFKASFTRTKETAPDEVEEYATATGAVDLDAGWSRASFVLAPLLPDAANPVPLDEPAELWWNGETVAIRVAKSSRRLPRTEAREDGGLLGRYPDEVDALDDLLVDALRPRLLGDEDGQSHYAFAIDSRKGGRSGFPAELSKAFAQASGGLELELEVWIGAGGLPHRLDYVVRLDPVLDAEKLVLPARTIRVTYALSQFGKSVEPDE